MNLFVISQIGQLYQAFALLAEFKIDNCHLLILYDNGNKAIKDQFNDLLLGREFQSVVFLKLPDKPTSINIVNIQTITSMYRKVFLDKSYTELFMCCFNKHYSILAKVAKDSGVKVNFFEEGLSTYKLALDDYNEERIMSVFAVVKQALRRSLSLIKSEQPVQNFNLSLFSLSTFLKELFLSEKFQKLLKYRLDETEKSFFTNTIRFDDIYVAYPSKLKGKIYYEKSYRFLHLEKTLATISISHDLSLYDFDEHDALFVSQKYSFPVKEYCNLIISILLDATERFRHVYIKLHPRELSSYFELLTKLIHLNGLEDKVTILSKELKVPAEFVIMNSPMKNILGLTSTALVYSGSLSKKINAISYGNYVLDWFKSNAKTKAYVQFKEHLRLIQLFSNVQILGIKK